MDKDKKAQYHAEWYKQNKAQNLETCRKARQKSPRFSLYSSLLLAKKRAEVTVTVDDLLEIYDNQLGLCALSGIKLTWSQGKWLPTSISMDRIDNSKGYVHGNVRLVCASVNSFKGTMNDDELLKMADVLVRNMQSLQTMNKCLEKEFV
jgi:hypothetical protein